MYQPDASAAVGDKGAASAASAPGAGSGGLPLAASPAGAGEPDRGQCEIIVELQRRFRRSSHMVGALNDNYNQTHVNHGGVAKEADAIHVSLGLRGMDCSSGSFNATPCHSPPSRHAKIHSGQASVS